MEMWEDFRRLAYSDEILIGLGALLVLVGIVKIVRSSLKMLFWVLLSALGLASISYGMDQNPINIGFGQKLILSDYIGQGKEMSADVLKLLCTKLEETTLLPSSSSVE